MEYSVALVQKGGGTPFHCYITEYMRTIIYRIPSHKVVGGHVVPTVVKETTDFKATVITNPVNYISNDGFSDQKSVDRGFEEALKNVCEEDKAEKTIFVAIQFKENLGMFPAVGGQCVRHEIDSKETIIVYDCTDARGPNPDQKTGTVNVILTAVRAELEVTDALEKSFDKECFKTDGGKCVYRGHIDGSAHVILVSPISSDDLTKRLQASRLLATKLEESIGLDRVDLLRTEANDFGTRLRELVEALQLDPSMDSAYRRLWYLQLWDRVEEFRRLFARRQRPPELRNNSLEDVTNHRHAIAHRRVDRLNGKMSRSLQQKAFDYFKQHL